MHDILKKGIRIFKFTEGKTKTLASLALTARMFLPGVIHTIPGPIERLNLNFLKDYAKIDMKERRI